MDNQLLGGFVMSLMLAVGMTVVLLVAQLATKSKVFDKDTTILVIALWLQPVLILLYAYIVAK